MMKTAILSEKEGWYVVATLLGNVVEFYDFIIYAFLASYMSLLFFPHSDPSASLLMFFGAHACGYVARPLGAFFFGNLGDKFGRKPSLLYSIGLTTFSTTAIGLIPTYDQIGILAPIILITLRIIQGFSVSGEQGGAIVFLNEYYSHKRSGLIGAIAISSIFIGILLGSFTCFILTSQLSESTMLSLGWRLPFILAFPLGALCLYLRYQMTESFEFKACQEKDLISEFPIKKLVKNYSRRVISIICLIGCYSSLTSFYMVYLPNALPKYTILEPKDTLFYCTVGLVLMVFLIPIVGILSDRVGSKKILKFGLLFAIAFSYPSFRLLETGNSILVIMGWAFLIIMIVLIAAPKFSLICSGFPVEVRLSGVTVSFNTSVAIFSGMTPVMANLISDYSKNTALPALQIVALAMLALMLLSNENLFDKS